MEHDKGVQRGFKVGLWTSAQNRLPLATFGAAAATLEETGVGELWFGEGRGRDPFMTSQAVLARCSLRVGIGVASVYARDAFAAVACERDLMDLYGDRFTSGYGISHPAQAAERGRLYGKPLGTMRAYFASLAVADEGYPLSESSAPSRVLAALGPRMLELGAEIGGVHTYCVPVAHTVRARQALGEKGKLVVEQAVVLTMDRQEGRRIATEHIASILKLENYARNLLRFGFTEEDLWPIPSRRLVAALVAFGPSGILDRVVQHGSAGASQVCLQVLDERLVENPVVVWQRASEVLEACG